VGRIPAVWPLEELAELECENQIEHFKMPAHLSLNLYFSLDRGLIFFCSGQSWAFLLCTLTLFILHFSLCNLQEALAGLFKTPNGKGI